MKEANNNLTGVDREELIIRHLLEGKTQLQISDVLKKQGIRPNSLSYVEKTIKVLREKHGARTMFHLGAILMLKRHIKRSS